MQFDIARQFPASKRNLLPVAGIPETRCRFETVDAAADFQREMSRLNAGLPTEGRPEFRIGVNLGEVIHDRGDIYRDDVNLAARIQALAEPGGVSVTGTVREQVLGKSPHALPT